MTTSRRIVLTLSPELYGRLEARAAEGRLDGREWAQRVLLAALSAPESKAARERRSREAGFALLSMLAGSTSSRLREDATAGTARLARHPAAERSNHAPNP